MSTMFTVFPFYPWCISFSLENQNCRDSSQVFSAVRVSTPEYPLEVRQNKNNSEGKRHELLS